MGTYLLHHFIERAHWGKTHALVLLLVNIESGNQLNSNVLISAHFALNLALKPVGKTLNFRINLRLELIGISFLVTTELGVIVSDRPFFSVGVSFLKITRQNE